MDFLRKNSSIVGGDGKDTSSTSNTAPLPPKNKRRFSDLRSFRQSSKGVAETTTSQKANEVEPSVVLTIVSPDMVSLPPNMVKDEWELYSAPQSSSPNITVHMHLLLVNLLNKYIRQQRVPREAIHLAVDVHMGTTVVQMIVSDSLSEAIQTDCRDILGIGQTIGMVYACPLDGYRIPARGTHPDSQLLVARPEVVRRMSASAVGAATSRMSLASTSRASSVQWGRMSSLVSWDGGGGESDEAATPNTAIHSPPLQASSDVARNLERVRQSLLQSSTSEKDQPPSNELAHETTPLLFAPNTGDIVEQGYASKTARSTVDDRVGQILEARKEWKHLMCRTNLEQIESQLLATFQKHVSIPTICATIITGAGIILHSALFVALGVILYPVMEPILGLPFGLLMQTDRLVLSSLGRTLWMLFISIFVAAIGSTVLFYVWGNDMSHTEWLSEDFFVYGEVCTLVSWALLSCLVGLATGSLGVLESLETRGIVSVVVSFCVTATSTSAGIYGGLAMLLHFDLVAGSPDVGESVCWSKALTMLATTMLSTLCLWIGVTLVWCFQSLLPENDDSLWSRSTRLLKKFDNISKGLSIQTINEGLQACREMQLATAQSTYSASIDEFLQTPQSFSFIRSFPKERTDLQLTNLKEVQGFLFNEGFTSIPLPESSGEVKTSSTSKASKLGTNTNTKSWGWKNLLWISCGILLAGDSAVCSTCEASLLSTSVSDVSETTSPTIDSREAAYKCPSRCADTRNRIGTEEPSARIFYLILVHNERTMQGALYLYRAIVDHRNTIVIHVDSKAQHFLDKPHALWDEIEHCSCGATVLVESVHSVEWGEWSMNLPTLWAMELAVNDYADQWDTFVSLAGDSLPVYKSSTMGHILQSLHPYNFVTSSSCETGLIPTNVYHFPSHWHKRRHYTENESVSPWIWNQSTSIEVHFGSQWVILQSDFVHWLVESLADETSLPSFIALKLQESQKLMTDETFLPTILMHAPEWGHTLPKVNPDTGFLISHSKGTTRKTRNADSMHPIAAVRYERMDEHVPTAFGYLWKNQRYDVPQSESSEKEDENQPQVDQPRIWGPYYLGVYDLAAIRKSGALYIRKVSDQIDENLLRLLPVERVEDIPFIDWPAREVTLTPKPNWQQLMEEIQSKRKQQQHGVNEESSPNDDDEEL